MNKYVLSFFFLLATLSVWGQSKSRVNLISSTTMRAAPGADGHRIIKVHNGVFKQDYSTLTSDSAYFYPDANMVDAFGHVVINQGDTVHIYSDKLNYNGNTKTAVLTDHVVMVDKDATLTTNNFTYNTATRIGTYVDGGKLVNKDNTLTSKNGYYFAFTRDAYFRYDVVCKTPDAVINTDTMRYNSGTRINYFYGPTIIKGKDKDNLYTENGTYNTILKQAAFGKKNLYTSQTKSLKGDSLFYDRLKGYGRAVKHVVFTDTEQKITILGDFGEYFKSNEEAVITQNAYMIFVTEDSTKAAAKDTSKAAAVGKLKLVKADSLSKLMPNTKLLKPGDKKIATIDSLVKSNQSTVDSLTQSAQKLADNTLIDKKVLQTVKDSVMKQLPAVKKPASAVKTPTPAIKAPVVKTPVPKKPVLPGNLQGKVNSITPLAMGKGLKKNPGAVVPQSAVIKETVIPKIETPVYRFADTAKEKPKLNPNIRYDSLFMAGDTFRTRMITYKDFKLLKQRQYELAHPDTSIKKVAAKPGEKEEEEEDLSKPIKHIKALPFRLLTDTAFRFYDYFANAPKPDIRLLIRPSATQGKNGAPAAVNNNAAATTPGSKITMPDLGKPKLSATDSLKVKQKADSLAALAPKGLSDTSRIRIINVYNNAKIFKSDLQAKADSMFYSSADSTIRMYVKPMIWTQKSQLSGDTVNLQMKNKKLDNLDMYPSGLIVNIEKSDSTHFNQAGGKFMHGQFKNGKLSSFSIKGNAETIYFKRDTVKNIVTDMSRTQSGRAYFNFTNGDISSIAFTDKYSANGYPISKVKEEDKKLKNFIWRPQDRPASKAAILSHRSPKAVKKPAAKPANAKGKPVAKGVGVQKAAADTSALKSGTDSLNTGKTDTTQITHLSGSREEQIKQLDQLRKQRGNQPMAKPAIVPPKAQGDTVRTNPALIPGRDTVRKDSARKDTTQLKKLTPKKSP